MTIDEIYAAINPLPAMLSEKGKAGVLARHRIDVGWSVEDALSRPVKKLRSA